MTFQPRGDSGVCETFGNDPPPAEHKEGMVPSLIFNGVTYGISQTRFEATRELLARFTEGHTLGVAMSLTHDGARHHLFITPGVPITLVE
ncbi:hypothetical protein R4316_30580 [Rhodococcus oxybenzonivorans]|nr:hypothetical protein [Rhodococcus oxybenzonivorans]